MTQRFIAIGLMSGTSLDGIDADVGRFLKLYTFMPMDEIARLEALGGSEINEAKKILATEITKLCRGEQAALQAAKTAQDLFEGGMAGGDLPVVLLDGNALEAGVPVLALLQQAGFAASNGEAKRLIAGGGARVNDNVVQDDKLIITMADMQGDAIKLSSGKKKHALVKVS